MRKHPWPIPVPIFTSYQAEKDPKFNKNICWAVFPRREKLEGELAGGLEEQVTGVILL